MIRAFSLLVLFSSLSVLAQGGQVSPPPGSCGPGQNCTAKKFISTARSGIGVCVQGPNADWGWTTGTSTSSFNAYGVGSKCSGAGSPLLNFSINEAVVRANASSGGFAAGTSGSIYAGSGGFQAPLAFASFPAAAAGNSGNLLHDSTNVVWRASNGSAWLTVAHEYVISGFHPGGTAPLAARPIQLTRARNPGKGVGIAVTQMTIGVNAASYTVKLVNSTTLTTLCTVTLSCAAAVGAANSTQNCTGAIAKDDLLTLEADTSPCATSAGFNVAATVVGG